MLIAGIVLVLVFGSVYFWRLNSTPSVAEKSNDVELYPDADNGMDVVQIPENHEPRMELALADSSVDSSLGENVEVIGTPPRPIFGKVAFVRRHELRPVADLARDPTFNPRRIQLSLEESIGLERFRVATVEQLAVLDKKFDQAAMSWAKLSMDAGQYQNVQTGQPIRGIPDGAVAVGWNKAGEAEGQLVVIKPGDCAELDVIALEQAELLASFHETAKEFFSAK
jgi:hypothetical protein